MSRFTVLVGLAIVSMLNEHVQAYTTRGSARPFERRRFGDSILPSTSPNLRQKACPLRMSSEPIHEPVTTSTQVIYQKVVRPSMNLPDLLFLGYLVEYIESYFELPEGLPMVYESLPGDDESRSILAWDSPLSPSPEATRMEVEVVGIYTDKQDETSSSSSSAPSIPKMAMVVVRKIKSSKGGLPPMMANLFQDAEKKILRALDRGLEDFVAGKIKFASDSPNPNKTLRNIRTAEEAIEAELMDSLPAQKAPKTEAKDVVFDTYATEDDSSEKSQAKVRNESMKAPGIDADAEVKFKTNQSRSFSNVSDDGGRNGDVKGVAVKSKAPGDDKRPKPLEDFAVAAARRVQEKKKEQQLQQHTTEDFAVAAARKVSASRQSEGIINKTKQATIPETVMEVPPGFKIPDYMGDQRAFRTTISQPCDRSLARSASQLSRSSPDSSHAATLTTETESSSSKATQSRSPPKPAKPFATKDTTASQGSKTSEKAGPSQEEIAMEVAKAAQAAMDEIAAQGETTPEQLLRDILKFGEEDEKENTPGGGFVSAAFDKAKDLMREQYQKRQANVGQELGFREPEILEGIRPNIDMAMSAEEELKRMFEAGERIAESRIIRSEITKDELGMRKTTDEDVDVLIAKDKSISSFARSLDEQLVALEVAINKSPGEELDGPKQYPLFDIMSGPEIYDPNVDPGTINYPGALPGTKKIELPKELREAIGQAQFAVEVLADLRTIEGDGPTKYSYGKKELTEVQVRQLQTVATEAIEIGLIKDPIRLGEESSRLQMLLDELSGQPDERFRAVAENYKDLLLSDNFVDLVKARLKKMAERDLEALRRDDDSLRAPHEREREILGQLVVYAQLLLKEARALGAELEAQQLEVIRSICQVAMDPKHQTEEETAVALSDAVRDMRPLLDDSFVAYLKYAVAEEQARLARAGLVDDPEHNQWLFVLKIVQQGVHAEISKSINRYIDHIWYVIRMETPRERRMLLSKLIDVMPTMDVRPFVKVVDNIVGALGDSTRGEFDEGMSLGEMTNKLLQMHRDVRELLPPERIAEKSRDADEWAARQKERLLEARKIGKQRLKAANDVAGRQDEIDAVARRGETERFDSL